jgi:hypothetical protein
MLSEAKHLYHDCPRSFGRVGALPHIVPMFFGRKTSPETLSKPCDDSVGVRKYSQRHDNHRSPLNALPAVAKRTASTQIANLSPAEDRPK